ncbi:sensor histidine kinase [Spelaeicoccus albus]|uniref:histidine kinase n=1 Tax=Spelaeicoccus albus TaxID=1280376 RepID=A0A7Z0AA18_9MICO|nr:HAMP domain-containing sensor histidine kinase [Spelaeicoccus albus]NYI66333.1 signal transduction histidine kinase [Spelaeicoccus albus]
MSDFFTSALIVRTDLWLAAVMLIVVILVIAAVVVAFVRQRRNARREAERRAAQAAAAEREEASIRRSRMLIRLDHELKNPLTALRSGAATLRDVLTVDGPADGDEMDAALKVVGSSSRRIARLLADLRKLADIETRDIDFTRVPIGALVEQAVDDARTGPGAEERTLVATVAKAPWPVSDVSGEEDMLFSAVLNLIGNALKYSRPGDTVEIRATELDDAQSRWVSIEVADTGIGIPSTEHAAVFDELARGRSGQVRAVAGSGMGLALVRAIVARHGGTVSLTSQEGEGTSVRMLLPALSPADP